MFLAALACPIYSQAPPAQAKAKIDEIAASVYETASARFPCRLKSGGKPKMLRWQDVAKCLNTAYDNVDWEDVSEKLQSVRKEFRLEAGEAISILEASFAARAVPFENVFAVKEKDEKVLLPLSNSLLKFLPEGSFRDLAVFDSKGKQIGTFVGTYAFERSTGIAGSPLIYFQYADQNGNVRGAPERLLLGEYGVRWKDAAAQRGFRLPSGKIVFR